MVQKKTYVQTIIFNRSKYNNKRIVRAWIKKNDFQFMKKDKGIETTEKYYIVRQRDPWRFKKKSLKTETVNKNIKKIIGRLK